MPQREMPRHRIEGAMLEIKLERKSSKFSVFFKLFADDREVFKSQERKRNQSLRWQGISYEASSESRMKLAVVSESTKQPTLTIGCDNGTFTVTFLFPTRKQGEKALANALSEAQATERKQGILEKIGSVRIAISRILDVIELLAELCPTAKAVLEICKSAWSELDAQEGCDASVETLVEGLSRILPYSETVQTVTKLAHLQKTIEALSKLLEDATTFIREYKRDGGAVKRLRGYRSSSAQEQVDKLLRKLQDLRNEFDQAVNVQALQIKAMNAQRLSLNELKPVGQARYDATQVCLPGTREAILGDVFAWSQRSDTPDGLLWIHGHAGLGKSAIATSICQRLDEKQQLAASFFCKRDDPERRNPQRVLTTIIYGLAASLPPYANAVATAIRTDSSLCHSPPQTQYDKLIRDTLQSLCSVPATNLLVVVDALDECGTEDTRRHLLENLHKMAQITPWLKVVVTSRPNKDINDYFDGSAPLSFSTKNVYEYNASADIRAFIRRLIVDSGKAYLLPEDTIGLLTEAAGGLFIWAQTACKFILSSHEPGTRLRDVLAGAMSSQSTSALDALYTTAIKVSVKDGGEDDTETVRHCLGMIIACSTRTPLSVCTLSKIIGERVEQAVLQSVVDSLGSVLYVDDVQEEAVRVYHPSFADYITNPERSGRFCVNIQQQDALLAECCLRTMISGLKFNICGLETSYRRNCDVPNLEMRIDSAISRHLKYSCLYWTNHLVSADRENQDTLTILSLLDNLMTGPEVLYWIEVLSLIGKVDIALSSLRALRHWYQETKPSERVKDIERFIQTFYDPISESTPHLYVSGLAFSPADTTITDLKGRNFPNVIRITQGIERTWPPWLRCIEHDSAVASVSISPDGLRIASSSDDNIVQVWDANTGIAVGRPLLGHSDSVNSVAFSPNGCYIVSGSVDNTVRVWDVETGKALGDPLAGHSNSVNSVVFSPDGRRIASGSYDGTVRVWDILGTSFAVNDPLLGHSDCVNSVAFAPDNRRIVSSSDDGTLRIWDADTGTPLGGPLAGHSSGVYSAKFSPDGLRIVSGSYDNTVRVWDAHTGTALGEPLAGHTDGVNSVAFSPDGCLIVSGSYDKTMRVWDAETGNMLGNPLVGHSDSVNSVVFSPDGRRIVSGSYDNTVRIWDREAVDTMLGNPPVGHSDCVSSVAFSLDGRQIVSGSFDNTVRVWDADTGIAHGDPLVGHTGPVVSVAFSPDGHRIVSGSNEGAVRVWDASTAASLGDPLVGHSDHVAAAMFSPDGHRVVSGSYDGTVQVWDADTVTALGDPLVIYSGRVTAVAISPDGRRIASGLSDGTLQVWDAITGSMFSNPLVGHSDCVNSVLFSPDCCRLVSGSDDRTVRVWDIEKGATLGEPLVGHSQSVTCTAFSPDGRHIVSGSCDETVRVWDVDTGTALGDPLVGHSDRVVSVAFSPNGRRIVSGSYDNTIRVWDADFEALTIDPLVEHSHLTGPLSASLYYHGPAISVPPGLELQAYDTVNNHSKYPANVYRLNDYGASAGWVSVDGNLLFWLPPEYRRPYRDDSLFVIADRHVRPPVWLDYSRFVNGAEWTNVFVPPH